MAANKIANPSKASGFDKKWLAYAIAGGAALAAPANASIIHYGGAPLTSTDWGSPATISVLGVDYSFTGQSYTGSGSATIYNDWSSTGELTNPLLAGSSVEAATFYSGAGSLNSAKATYVGDPAGYSLSKFSGNIPNGDNVYLGLRFDVGGQQYYGWAELNAAINASPTSAVAKVTVLDFAYQDAPGVDINAGATGAVPKPSTLALFALGAAGLAAVRRRARKA